MNITDMLRNYEIYSRIQKILLNEYDLMLEFGDFHAQRYSERIDTGGHVNKPVEEYVQRKERLAARISELEVLIEPVSRLIFDLSLGLVSGKHNDTLMLEILNCHYWKNESLSSISRRMGLKRQTVRSLRNMLTDNAEKYVKS